jgi:hypothetical protein
MKGSSTNRLGFSLACILSLVVPAIALMAGCAEKVTGPDGPAAPSYLQITGSTDESVTLNWIDNSDDEEGFKIWQSLTKDRGYRDISRVDPDVTSVTVTGLADSISYYFRTSAYNESGNSRLSNTVRKKSRTLTVGDTLIDYVGIDQYSQDVSLHSYKGKILFLYFAELEEG